MSDFDSPPQSPCIKTPTALPSLVEDEVDDLTPLPQGIQSHSQSGSRISPRPPLTRISSSDKLQTRAYEKASGRGRHSSEERTMMGKSSVSGRKSDSQERIEGPGGSQHLVFRYVMLFLFVLAKLKDVYAVKYPSISELPSFIIIITTLFECGTIIFTSI